MNMKTPKTTKPVLDRFPNDFVMLLDFPIISGSTNPTPAVAIGKTKKIKSTGP